MNNDIDQLEDRCNALEKECRTLREVLSSIIAEGVCPLSHDPVRSYRSMPCDWCGKNRPPDESCVEKIKTDAAEYRREREQRKKS